MDEHTSDPTVLGLERANPAGGPSAAGRWEPDTLRGARVHGVRFYDAREL